MGIVERTSPSWKTATRMILLSRGREHLHDPAPISTGGTVMRPFLTPKWLLAYAACFTVGAALGRSA